MIYDAICAIYAIIDSKKRYQSIKMFLDHTVCTLVPATIFMLLVFNGVPSRYRIEVETVTIAYLCIGMIYNFVKDMKSISKNNRLS